MAQKLDIKKTSVTILAPGAGDDSGWSESAIKAGELLGQLGFLVTGQPDVPASQALAVANAFCQAGANLIIGHGCEYFLAFEQLAAEFPGTYFFVMDKLENREDWPSNFCCLHQRQYEAIYLCGRLAANLTESKKVGFVGGEEVPTQLSNGMAFENGSKSLDPSIEVVTRYANSFVDPVQGKKIALELIKIGVDVVMHSASESGNGVIEACKENGVSVIGYVLDQSHMAPEVMAASMLLDVPDIYKTKAIEVVNGAFQPGVWRIGLTDGLVDLASFHQEIPAKVLVDIDKTRQAIIDKKIVI
jgi:basic membrane protein A and related proteins